MKCGDRGKVKFRFLKYPECIHIGDKIIVFESKIRAVGLITEVK
jgi:GTPase